MKNVDISSLIDWNSPTVEYICKPLIPLPNFDGQPVIDGNNPFDDLEKQIDLNEPFDMILNQSLNSSSEQIDLDKSMDTKEEKLSDMSKGDKINSETRIIDTIERLNLHSDESVKESPLKNEHRYSTDVSNVMDVSPIGSDASEVQILRKRLSTILDKFSKPNDEVCQVASNNLAVSFIPPSTEISCSSLKSSSKEYDSNDVTNPSKIINNAFIGKDGSFDSLMFNVNNLYEDLSSVNQVWDELVLISSSSDEEQENSPVKSIPSKVTFF